MIALNDNKQFTTLQSQQSNLQALIKEMFLKRLKQKYDFRAEELVDSALEITGLPPYIPFRQDLIEWIENIYNLSFLKQYLINEDLKEFLLFSHKQAQTQTKKREFIRCSKLSSKDYQLALEVLALKNRKEWNYSDPFVSFHTLLFGKSFRVTLCHHSLTPRHSSKAFFRPIKKHNFTLEDFNITQRKGTFLEKLIDQKKNILVVGPTGSGKTSLLRTLINKIPKEEHLITLEDTYELINQRENMTSLLSSQKADDLDKSLEKYCSYALRMKPDRLILGEIRSAEVVPFLLASNTGHKGLMASLHANSAIDSVSRLCLLFQIYSPQKGLNYQEVLKVVCQGLDYIIYTNDRRVLEIIKITGSEGATPYFQNCSF